MITLFGSGNVELLHLINSQFANFSIFSAPFSSEALNWIFWGGFIDILIEDLPQLIIQVLTFYVIKILIRIWYFRE